MSRIRANTITNQNANGAPNFPDGITVSGVVTATVLNSTLGTLAVTGNATVGGTLGVGGTITYEDVTNIDSVGIITARAGVNVVGNDLNVGSNIKLGNASGIITATSYRGDASQMTGAGLGTDGSANTSGIITATAFVPTTGQLSHRNIIVNGAMNVAQRGTSSTSDGIHTVDRFQSKYSGTDEATTQQQADVSAPSSPYHLPTSGDHPYKGGFRKCFSITNGNQTSGAGAGDYVFIRYKIEAQDLANSGWDYTSTSSFITLSFWVKSSVAQNFYGRLETQDGTKQNYPFETGSLTAFTWTKISKTIPGNSNITIDNNTQTGIELYFYAFLGTDQTDNSVTNDAWAAYASGTRVKDNTSTWYTTNDASFQITGVQLEVGSVSTPFEHRSFSEEIQRCMRYYEKSFQYPDAPANNGSYSTTGGGGAVFSRSHNGSNVGKIQFKVEKRANPGLTFYGNGSGYWYSPSSGYHQHNSVSNGPDRTGFYPRQQASGSIIDVQGHYSADAEL